MSINKKKMRRLSTAFVGCALAITLTSCSGATNKYGSLDRNATYASIGDYKITNGELWDELQWNAIDVLNEQAKQIVLTEQMNRLTTVVKTNGDYSKLENKKILHSSTEEISNEDFNELYDMYKKRLADYVVQDIFNLGYERESYWEKIEDYDEIKLAKSKKTYLDEIYTTYQKSTVADGDLKGKTFEEIIEDVSEDNIDGLFAIATTLSELYYPEYAKELFTFDKLSDESDEAFKDDTDDDDEKYGLYKTTEYVSKFKEDYTNKYDVKFIQINFTSTNEFNDTLRAFGIYVNNGNLYYIYDDKEDENYAQYIEHYDEFTDSQSNLKTEGAEQISGKVVLEIYIMLYNYMYGGYRDMLPSASGVALNFDDLNTLRLQTLALLNQYKSSDEDALYASTIEKLIEFDNALDEDDRLLTHKAEEIDKISSSFKTYCYETLKLKDSNDYDSFDTRYSTTLQTAGDNSCIVYKFDDTLDEITDEKALEYEKFYLDKNNTTIDYFDYITKEENKELFNTILKALLWNNTSESIISNKTSEAADEVKVKVYTEATEIAYAKDHDKYSKSVGKAKNKNILATLKYDGTTYNLNIKANDDDKNSIKVPGYDKAFGVFDYLEGKNGPTTAIDLLSRKIVKSTKQYEEVKKDKTNTNLYTTYIQNVLSNFANDGYSSNGFPSTIGKYNFLMLYYHSANIKNIINDYYMVQLASAKLLTNYSNPALAEFLTTYTSNAYDKYFSLEGKRLVIYMDADEDGEADETTEWVTKPVTNWVDYNGNTIDTNKGYVARQLAYTIYNKLGAAANSSHSDKLTALVSEINDSAKAEYNDNPSAAENIWARYKKLGLNVKLEDLSVTNSSTDVDYSIKQRLYDYARGHNEDNTIKYQYYINNTTPTEYMEVLTEADITEATTDLNANPVDENIIISKDGINLLLITTGNSTSSAKWSKDDHEDTLLQNIVLKYNEEYITIKDVFNEEDKLNSNQIQLYILDNAINSSSSMSPTSINDSLTNFLSPVYTRYTSAETQRIILLYFMKNYTKSTANIYSVINYSNETYNGESGFFKKMILINQDIADGYSYLNKDTTGTSDLYDKWWEDLEAHVESFLIDLDKEAK